MRNDWPTPSSADITPLSSCGQCLTPLSFSEKLLNALLRPCGITFVLCLILLLTYFIAYKHKKDSNSFEHAIEKAGIGGIIIFISLTIIFVILTYAREYSTLIYELLVDALLCGGSIAFILCLVVLLIYFIIYKHKKDSNPFKHAIKKTGVLGIIIFIIRIVIIALACIFG